MQTARIAVVGATGLVGRELLTVLGERQFPISTLRLYSSLRSAGDYLECGVLRSRVDPLEAAQFDDVDIVFLAANETVSVEAANQAADAGALVIDTSQIFADDLEVPLVAPEVNAAELANYATRRIVTSPDAIAVALAVVLNPLRETAGLRRVVATTFESVSGAGQAGIDELQKQTIDLLHGRSTEESAFDQRIAFNLFPQVGPLLAGGVTRGEQVVVEELRRLLDYPELPVSVTRVRVPLFHGQAIAINLETEQPLSIAAAHDLLRSAPGLLLQDELDPGSYPTPAGVVSQDAISVGRLRSDNIANTVDLWLAIDNLRKGSAVNAVQIAEILIREYL